MPPKEPAMRFDHRSPAHWIAVALVAVLALFTFSHAWGQGAGATAVFEGRPALAGAQGGLGAQSGMPQGGLGVQGNEAAQRQLRLRKPSGLDSMPAAAGTAGTAGAAGSTPAAASTLGAPPETRSDVTLVPKGDSVAREVQSPTRKAKRAVKRTVERARTGTSGIDSEAAVKP
jgi:hypothetical protein